MERTVLSLIEAEYRRYERLGRAALDQLDPDQLHVAAGSTNSAATMVWHLSGNLESRFTDFLTTDGEKPWRDRDSEFLVRPASRAELVEKWERGWAVLFATLATLGDPDLAREITIRGVGLRVDEALFRSLAHVSYHVGQIVYLAKGLRGDDWRYLSIRPGGTAAYNRNPDAEKPAAHAARLGGRGDAREEETK